MLLYYTQRIKDKKITSIINEATNKYIELIKEKIEMKKNDILENEIEKENIIQNSNNNINDNYYNNNNGLLIFVSFISFICGYSYGRKCIQI
jgi:hypothetical protein